ncbi:MAG: UPF0158 family protein [Planctomycetota bacterium]|jgi:hypothetical protein
MSICVLLSKIVEVLDIQGDEDSSYLDKKTGEVISLRHDDFSAAEDGESLDNYAQWECENIQIAEKILNDCHKNYLELPTKFDVNEYRIMERFCFSVQDEEICQTLCNTIRGSGAFRRFKDSIYRFGIDDNWHKYRNEALKKRAIDWCEANDIAYEDDLKDSGH